MVPAMPFVIGSYQAVERPGAGHHAAPVGLWRGEDLRTIDDVALTVLPADCFAAARSGVDQVRSVRHPHLLPVTDVVVDDDRVAIVSPWPRAGRLSELVSRRGRLTPAETLTVMLPIAGALATAHAQGFRHGGVCPEAIWFDASGRPLLGALAAGRIVADVNGGMPASCRDVAPEVVRGEVAGDAPAVAADVFSLGSVALFCLTGRSAWPADDPVDVLVQSAAGLWPDPPDDGVPALLVELVRAMLVDDPPNRPTAATVAEELAVVGDPVAIAFGSGPAPAPASADRWRGWSSPQRSASGGVSNEVPNPASDGATPAGSSAERTPGGNDIDSADRGTAGTADVLDPDAEVDPDDADAPGAGRRLQQRFRTTPAARAQLLTRAPIRPVEPADPARPTPVAKLGIAVLVGLLITLVAAQVIGWTTGQDDPTAAVGTQPTGATSTNASSTDSSQGESTQWVALVEQLDHTRGSALQQADSTILDAVYTDDAPAKAADAATIVQLATQGWHVQDAVHQISDVAVVDPPDAAATGDQVRLAVVDVLPARPITDGTGQQVGMTPARAEQRRILTVRRTAAGYRISDIEPG
jgi:serine/threonine-protein kinase